MKIVADAHIPRIHEYFAASSELVLLPGRQITPADVKDADILLVRSITHVDAALLADSRVKFVGSVTAGADHLDIPWLDAQGIAWATAHGFNALPVADYVVSVVAALQRRGMLKRKQLRAAVIGVGSVGRLVVERLGWLGFDVLLCDPLRAEHEPDFVSTPINELAEVDLISLHVPLTKAGAHPTRHLIDKHFMQRQKLGCVLLNASRGAVINTHDLLQHGAHLHWCFDVWEHEPKIDKTILEHALIASPHIAGYSVQSKLRGIEMIYQVMLAEQFIPAGDERAIIMPAQTLAFAGSQHHWQDIVLGIFNPLIMTAMMRSSLLPADDGHAFDEMRNKFNYRYEFSATTISDVELSSDDVRLIQQLGIRST